MAEENLFPWMPKFYCDDVYWLVTVDSLVRGLFDLRTRPSEDEDLLRVALEAMEGLANTFHEGRALADSPASEGYVGAAVDSVEGAITRVRTRLATKG